jgi:transcriptional regulator of arginine metabolism
MKSARQEKILELIYRNDVETQEDLLSLLNESGYKVTQATVSRDIRELKLIKKSNGKGRQKYAASSEQTEDFTMKYAAVFREGFVSADTAENILVVKTVSGMAMAVAAAIDAMNYKEIVGSIAGDDTIMCAVRSAKDAVRIKEKLELLVR